MDEQLTKLTYGIISLSLLICVGIILLTQLHDNYTVVGYTQYNGEYHNFTDAVYFSDDPTPTYQAQTPYVTFGGVEYGSGGSSTKICTSNDVGSCIDILGATDITNIPGANGIINFSLCLYTDEVQRNVLVVAGDQDSTSCQTNYVVGTPTWNFTQTRFWIANGAGKNYTSNYSTALSANISPFPANLTWNASATTSTQHLNSSYLQTVSNPPSGCDLTNFVLENNGNVLTEGLTYEIDTSTGVFHLDDYLAELSSADTYANYSSCNSETETTASTQIGNIVNYLGTSSGGLASWIPLVIVLVVGLFFLGALMVKRGNQA